MSCLLSAELSAACNALGSYDPKSNRYLCDDNILETVKDLIRYLRRDNESHEIRRHFGATNIVQINLIPLLKLYWEQNDMFDVLLRLLGNLTSPVLLLYNEEVPKEKTVRNHFLQILGHLQSYKEAFADSDLWAVLCTKLSQLLSIEWQERGEENGLIIERILILVRNVLNVPADPDAEKRPDNDVSAHDKMIWSLRQSGLNDLFLYMVNSEQEEPYYMYLLEILLLILREHRPIDVAHVNVTRSESDKVQDEAEFLAVRKQEQIRRAERMKRYTSARHSQFGGTYVIKNMKSVNDSQELIYHKPLNKLNMLDFDSDKCKAKIPKNRAPLHETNSSRRSTYSIRLLLKELCIEFLNAGYNHLMYNVRRKLVRSGKSITHDESYYLLALKFFMEFNRHDNFDMKFVSETMSIQIFHYVQQQMEHNFDMIVSDKTNYALWSKRLHIAIQAFKELLFTLNAMDKSSDNSIRESTKVIKSNVFYVVEYREFILTLMLMYNSAKMSDAYLLDLIEMQHIFLKLLESYCGNNSVIVQRKQKAKKKKNKKKKNKDIPMRTGTAIEDLETQWDELAPQLSTVLEMGGNIPVVVPFDAASDIPIDDQRKNAAINIQNHLRANEIENAIGLLRAAREVWPENDAFGSSLMSVEDEFLAMKDIFVAEIQETNVIENQNSIPFNEEESDDEENEEDIDDQMDIEVEFDFQNFINRFAHPKVIQACALALHRFDTNPVMINHYVVKLLHRIAWDCRMPAMIFQASIFRTFQRIFMERHRTQHKELVKFATYIIRQFVKVTQKNPKVYIELLFWKNSKEAYDVEEGYGSYQENSKAMKATWTEQQEDELRVLMMEYREKDIQEDVINWILSSLIDNTKTRRMIIKKLKEMMLLTDYKARKNNATSLRPPIEWAELEVTQLTELYNQFKEATDPLRCIIDRLDIKRAKARVVEKLLDLGLIMDKKELRRKRTGQIEFTTENADNSSGSDSDSSIENRPSVSNTVAQKITNRNPASKSIKKRVIRPNLSDTSVLRKLIADVINKGFTDSLKWLSESLSDAIEDFSSEDNEGIPLVPIAEADISAMDNPSFQKMLLAMGMAKPADEQEIYWRIHASKASDLTQLNTTIEEVLQTDDNNLIRTEHEPSSDEEDVFDRLRNLISEPVNERIDDVTQLENIEHSTEITEKNDENKKKSKRLRVLEESDTSDLENNIEDNLEIINENVATRILEDSEEEPSTTVKSKRLRVLEESDSSDLENNMETINKDATTGILEDSDDETSVKRNRDINSDSDSREHGTKRIRIIADSDSE